MNVGFCFLSRDLKKIIIFCIINLGLVIALREIYTNIAIIEGLKPFGALSEAS